MLDEGNLRSERGLERCNGWGIDLLVNRGPSDRGIDCSLRLSVGLVCCRWTVLSSQGEGTHAPCVMSACTFATRGTEGGDALNCLEMMGSRCPNIVVTSARHVGVHCSHKHSLADQFHAVDNPNPVWNVSPPPRWCSRFSAGLSQSRGRGCRGRGRPASPAAKPVDET